MSLKGCSLEQLAALVSAQLTRNGIDVVIVGGFAVAHYSSFKYVTQDVDFVDVSYKSRELQSVMEDMGFSRRGRYYTHPDTTFVVEFPPGPLSVGDRIIKPQETVAATIAGVTVRMLSPEDIIKDRLAAYIHWKDRQSLYQAAEISRAQNVDPDVFRDFILAEGSEDAWREFLAQLATG